eukprot:CAMPEP_0113608034 /NCGR_PEP_ID=MMETSP0017_2-20120614/3704_1 /TAXON_ID=2856 /ORGANISM="Cylindrotheca closterium" /LENGTH=236 /DNA_ID=CAMNT_0000516681 /DNA_START=38 /DNA_END=748 /DNA_ORIENTATION=+ /assembly_acc=CAM_ASM_000147
MMKRKRKAVSFASSPSQVLYLPETGEDEQQAKWYSKQEYAEFKAAIVKSVNAMGTDNDGGENICSRGIEFMTHAGIAYRKQIKLKVLAAVWNGQVRQWNEQNRIHDPVSIALACQKETLQCMHMAWTLGQLDQEAATKEYQTMFFCDQSNQTNQANSYSGGALQNQSNNCIGGDLQKEPAEQSRLFSDPTNNIGGDLDMCPIEPVTLAGKRAHKSSLDGSSHGPRSPAKRLNAIAA